MIKKFLLTLALCFLALPAFAMLPYNSNGQITPPDSDTINNYSLVASTAGRLHGRQRQITPTSRAPAPTTPV